MQRLKALINFKMVSIVRICDLIKIDFEYEQKKLCLHVQRALFRIMDADNMIVSSCDMAIPGDCYKRKVFKKFKWDKVGNTLFDDEIKKNKEKLINLLVKDVIFCGKDLILCLESDIRIEILADTLEPDCKIYRFFESNNLDSHLVVET